jgi:hypothetical protein
MVQPLYRRNWRTVSAPVPAAGVNWTLRPSGGGTWRVVSLVARLVTDANVANRRVTLSAGDGERTWWQQTSSADQAASLTTDYAAYAGATAGGSVPGTLTVPLPTTGLLLRSGHRLTVAVTNIQAGDAWSAIHAIVDEILSSRDVLGDSTGPTEDDYPEGA